MSDLLKLYEDHFSVLEIKEKYKIQNNFQFREVSPDEVRKIIQSLNKKKSAISSTSLKNGIFLDELKLTEVISLFRKLIHDKINYQPVSLLSKVFEIILQSDINESLLSNLLTLQHCPLEMLEKCKEA